MLHYKTETPFHRVLTLTNQNQENTQENATPTPQLIMDHLLSVEVSN
jgi:hypothetical protein